eukprot:TRINITY_DN20386_c0_g1_i1.p1 TRINITY_DN20386_c0_g1~~TRINITY_DN20386_c0_g1_i1.p1  ORF type:complete len:247 (+),score=61.18 TRINITY_DN20386_c0_g1_i1:28-768(+)
MGPAAAMIASCSCLAEASVHHAGVQSSYSDRLSLRSSILGESVRVSSVGAVPAWPLPSQGLSIDCKESRIGKAPIAVPKEVTVKLDGQALTVKGPLGELSRVYPGEISLNLEGGVLKVGRSVDTRRAREFHGLFRTLTSNMVTGVSKGFEKKLQLIGVGYRAALDKNELVLNLGYSHQVRVAIPEGIKCKVEENTRISIAGKDKIQVGDFSAQVRAWRPPEPYKGKGVKYQDEVIRRKEGKVGKKK